MSSLALFNIYLYNLKSLKSSKNHVMVLCNTSLNISFAVKKLKYKATLFEVIT